MAKIKIDAHLFQRARRAAELAGYSSMDEFIQHIVETEVSRIETQQASSDPTDRSVADQLRGLGYID